MRNYTFSRATTEIKSFPTDFQVDLISREKVVESTYTYTSEKKKVTQSSEIDSGAKIIIDDYRYATCVKS